MVNQTLENPVSTLATVEKYGYKLGMFASGTLLFYEKDDTFKGKNIYLVSSSKNTLEIMPQNVFDELSTILVNYFTSKK